MTPCVGAGEDITLSLYTSQDSMSPGGYYRATVTIFHKDGSKQMRVRNLPTPNGGFALTTAPALTTTEAYKKIEVKIEYNKGGGYVWIDDVSLVALP